jgi:hypothetical protein
LSRGDRLKRLGVAIGAGMLVMLSARLSHARPFDANGNEARVIGGRPAGCPHAVCGCGLAKYLGLNDRRLWLAWNWARLFPHTHARAGAAAVRHHHVMLLIEHIAGNRWLVKDWNGGRHLAWEHVRDVRGYVFVDPSNRVGALQ